MANEEAARLAAVARFEALLSPEGAELLAALPGEPLGAQHALRLGVALRSRYPAELVATALAQQELRLKARAKFGRAMDMFFTRPGLEQASAEMVARHRARRYAAAAMVADLCCGIGGDLLALAAGHRVLAVDADPLALRVVRANAEALGVAANVTTRLGDVRDAGLAGVDAVFIDPARRSGQRRLPVTASEPPLEWCLRLTQRAALVGIKTAPGVPRSAAPPGWELEFVAVGRDLKEAALWSPALATAATRATILPGGHALARAAGAGPAADGTTDRSPADRSPADGRTIDGEPTGGEPAGGEPAPHAAAVTLTAQPGPDEPVEVREPGEFLLDPNPAVTRAGLVAELARLTETWQIDPQIAFLSSASAVTTPFARTLRVIDSAPWRQRELPARLRGLDIGAVDIRRRGLAGDVDDLRRRLRLTGSRRATLVMTRVSNKPWGLVCVDMGDVG
jgi:SAM-dependent methyltransferase